MSKEKIEFSLTEQNELIRTLKQEWLENQYLPSRKSLNEYELIYESQRLIAYVSSRLRESENIEQSQYWQCVLGLIVFQAKCQDRDLYNRVEMTLSTLLKE